MDFSVINCSREDREISKKVLTPGDSNIVPYEDSKCQISITNLSCVNDEGAEDNIEEESLYLKESFNGNLTIGNCDNFIDIDIDLLIQQMCKGEVSLARIIYKNNEKKVVKRIEFKIELIEASQEDLISDWDSDRLYSTSLLHKERGVQLVKQKRVIDGFRRFSKALKLVVAMEPIEAENPISDEKISDLIDLKIKLYNNLALCQLQFKEYDAALQLCNQVLKLDAQNIKAVYRRSTAYMGLKMYEEAWSDIQLALRMDPCDVMTQQRAMQIKPYIDEIYSDYSSVIKRMFD